MRLLRSLGPICGLVLFSLALDGAIAAQTAASTGTISGTVTDPQGKTVAGATVTVRSTDLSATRRVVTDGEGHFSVPLLPPAAYSVQASAKGLTLARPESVALALGGSQRLRLKLALTTASQVVTVSGRGGRREGQTVAPPIDKESAESTNAIAGLTVTYLPNRDRDFSQFGELAADTQTNDANTGIDIDGQRSTATATEVDGANFDDPLEGGRRGSLDGGAFFPHTVVREFQVVHAGAGASVGDTNGGFLNIATKEGSNTFHGEQFYIYRPSGLTAHDAFGHSLDNTQNEIGGSVGGPMKKNKLYFYAGGEQDFLDAPWWTGFQPQAPGTVMPAGLSGLQTQTVGKDDPTALSLRLDAVLNANESLNLQGNYNRIRYSNFNPDSTQESYTAANADSLSGQSGWLRANLTSQVGAGRVNQLLAQWASDRRDFMPNQFAPEIVINGFGTLGGDGVSPQRYVSTQRGVSDDVAFTWREQLIHVGTSFGFDPGVEQHEADLNGEYDFNSLAAYLADAPRRYQQTFDAAGGDPIYRGTVQTLGVYADDKIPVGEKWTLTAGLRWEGQWNPQPTNPNAAIPQTTYIPDDLAQWQPRLGLAWNPKPNTIVRISSGMYDAPTPAAMFQRIFTDNGVNTVVADSDYDPQVLALATAGGMNGLAAPPATLAVPAALVEGIDANFRNPRSLQSAASLEQQMGRHVDFSAGYTHNSTWDLQRVVDGNLFAPTIAADGTPVFPATRPLPGVGQLLLNESSAHSSYDGLATTANFRLPGNLTLMTNYTLSRARDDASEQGPFGLVTTVNPFDLAAEAAYAAEDVRNAFNISGTDNFKWGLKVNPIFIARSGMPYTPIIGFDTQNDGNDYNDRAILNGQMAGRDSLRQPAFYNLDLRFVKDVTLKGSGHHLDLFADVFNVTNAGNKFFGPEAISEFGTPSAPVYSAGLPLFAPATTAFGGPRQVQFTVRLVGF